MHKLLMLALLLVTLTAWVQAQTNDQSGMASGQSMSSHKTVEGCLQGSNGSYTLTAKDGTMYQLSGDTSKLSEHIGHEVQITGMTSASATDSSAGVAAGSSQQTLEVKSVKHISKTCKSAMSQ
jgi:Protein of unknown function (DUF5818)